MKDRSRYRVKDCSTGSTTGYKPERWPISISLDRDDIRTLERALDALCYMNEHRKQSRTAAAKAEAALGKVWQKIGTPRYGWERPTYTGEGESP